MLSVKTYSNPDSRVEIYDLRSHTHPSFTRIVVDIGKLREYYFSELSSPDRIYVDIYQAKLNPILHSKSTSVKNGYVNKIRIAQKNPTTVRVVLDLDKEKIKRYQVWHIFDPFRIVIDIYPQASTRGKTPEKVSQPAKPSNSGYSVARQLGLGIQRVVIDPGHGGKDPGCIGKKGSREKDVVLDVSIRLKQLMTTNTNLDVIMTRESDIFIPVENRPVIANQKQSDLFISIHANSNPRKNRSGVQTFFLNFSSDPSVIETAARENATSSKNISDMRGILRKIVRNVKIEESQALAEKIQNNLLKHLQKSYRDVKDLGVKGGPFWVLIGGEMPSILVEISHLSNRKEESRLKSNQYRQQIAQGIFKGILEYINSLGKG
jgi:N-acetylmuramoyl-L-alanine amidase